VAPRIPATIPFLTTDVTPLERGDDGSINILVGMETSGTLTGSGE
jgi:hypothetical protein